MPAVAEGKLIYQAGNVGNGKVVVRLRVIGLEVKAILRRRRIALERSRRVVERVLPCKRVQQGEASDKALLVANLQSIEV